MANIYIKEEKSVEASCLVYIYKGRENVKGTLSAVVGKYEQKER